MLLTTLSAGVIVHSAPLTKYTVTGCYQLQPGIFKKNISTQQSTWMALNDGSGAAVALEDGGGAVALGGGIDGGLRLRWRHWAVVAAEEHATMGLASALLKPRGNYYGVGVPGGKGG
jgi:hypothetical protein